MNINFGAFKILVATSNLHAINAIKRQLNKKYQIINSISMNDTIKKIFNESVSLILLDTKQNGNIGKQDLYSLLYDINMTKKIPIIMMDVRKGNIKFNTHGFDIDSQTYGIQELDERMEDVLIHSSSYYTDNEDVQNFMSSLILALESKDEYSKNHSARVAKYATQLAKDMNSSKNFVHTVNMSGWFHDIGKISIPDSILLKPGRLTDDEFAIIQRHPVVSEKICAPIKVFDRFLPIIRGHHERVDGRGYPDGLRGAKIPLEARIIAVADTFDALTSNRSYRKALSMERVLQIMKDGAGTQWDADVVTCFLYYFNPERMANILRQSTSINFTRQENLIRGTIFDTDQETLDKMGEATKTSMKILKDKRPKRMKDTMDIDNRVHSSQSVIVEA